MKIILKEESEAEAFIHSIINKTANQVIGRLKDSIELLHKRGSSQNTEVWLNTEETMNFLKVGKNTMQKLRDESPMNGIIISQVSERNYLYNLKSLQQYLEKRTLK